MLKYNDINGLKVDMQNLGWTTINEMQQIISTCIQKNIIAEVQNSEFYGLMIEESCVLSVDEKLVICVKYIVDGEAVTSYLCSVQVPDEKAYTITNGLRQKRMMLDMKQIVSLGTDGAATKTDRKFGVGVKMQAKFPFMTQTHCFAHSLPLGYMCRCH